MRAMFLPRRRGCSVPACFAAFSSAARPSRKCHSVGVKSNSLRKLRLRRLNDIFRLLDCVALDGTTHAPRTATPPAEFAAGDSDHLDALPAEERVGGDVALIADDDPGLEGQEVAAVVPLLALRCALVLVGPEYPGPVDAERLCDRGEEVSVRDDLQPVLIGVGQHGPG